MSDLLQVRRPVDRDIIIVASWRLLTRPLPALGRAKMFGPFDPGETSTPDSLWLIRSLTIAYRRPGGEKKLGGRASNTLAFITPQCVIVVTRTLITAKNS